MDDLPRANDPSAAASSPRTHAFPRARRLLTGAEFDAVFANRLSVGDGVLVLHARPNAGAGPRVGLVVSRKVGNAVRRNRWKRLLREAFRLEQHTLPAMDLVCIPRMRDEPTFQVARDSLRRLAERASKKAAKRAGESFAKRPGNPAAKRTGGSIAKRADDA